MIPPLAEYYLDNDIASGVATSLRSSGYVAVPARDLRLRRATDDEHLLVAADAHRVFVTHNEEDFVLLHDAWLRWFRAKDVHAEHGGIIVVPQGRRYGVDWTPERIAQDVLAVTRSGGNLANELLIRRDRGWLRRNQGRWIAWP